MYTMSLGIVTTVGNKEISERLKGMLVDLRNSTATYFEQIKKIRNQAHSEGLDQIKYILYDKARRARQKSLTIDLGRSPQHDNIPSIPAPDYKIVVPDQVIEEEQEQLTQQQQEYKPEYALEDLRSQVESYKSQIEELTADKKNIEEKYKQLEAKTRVSPSNSIPAVQGNNLRTKVVVEQIFREVLALKGSKMIYANILIDLTQNKYVRLEPL
jgi:hypothetical protein